MMRATLIMRKVRLSSGCRLRRHRIEYGCHQNEFTHPADLKVQIESSGQVQRSVPERQVMRGSPQVEDVSLRGTRRIKALKRPLFQVHRERAVGAINPPAHAADMGRAVGRPTLSALTGVPNAPAKRKDSLAAAATQFYFLFF